jgi:hypothetical protein
MAVGCGYTKVLVNTSENIKRKDEGPNRDFVI